MVRARFTSSAKCIADRYRVQHWPMSWYSRRTTVSFGVVPCMLNQLPPNIIEFIDGVNTFDIDHREFWGKQTVREEPIDHWLCCLVTSVAYCHSSLAIAASRTSGEASATMGLPRRWRNLPGVM
jgi:hypothetical protein